MYLFDTNKAEKDPYQTWPKDHIFQFSLYENWKKN